MAGVLVIQPTNLTELSGQDGTFPTARVVARIDGRDPLVSHGSPMPVYGPYFEGSGYGYQGTDGAADPDQYADRRFGRLS